MVKCLSRIRFFFQRFFKNRIFFHSVTFFLISFTPSWLRTESFLISEDRSLCLSSIFYINSLKLWTGLISSGLFSSHLHRYLSGHSFTNGHFEIIIDLFWGVELHETLLAKAGFQHPSSRRISNRLYSFLDTIAFDEKSKILDFIGLMLSFFINYYTLD